MPKLYFIRNNTILEGEFTKESTRGTAAWIKPTNTASKKLMLVSYSKIFESLDEAKKYLNAKICSKLNQEKKFKKDMNEIDKIMEKAYKEYGVLVPFLSRPRSVDAAKKFYNSLKYSDRT